MSSNGFIYINNLFLIIIIIIIYYSIMVKQSLFASKLVPVKCWA